MASPITGVDFEIQNFSGDLCERIRKLLELNNTLKDFFEWMFDDNGELTSAFLALVQSIATPTGAVLWMPVSTVPAGYLIANGQAVSRETYSNLFSVIGTTFGDGGGSSTFNIPDLQWKGLWGADLAHPVGQTGGADSVTLTAATMPEHSHLMFSDDNVTPNLSTADDPDQKSVAWAGGAGENADYSVNTAGDEDTYPAELGKTSDTGGGQSYDNMPPYRVGLWLIKH